MELGKEWTARVWVKRMALLRKVRKGELGMKRREERKKVARVGNEGPKITGCLACLGLV
jgi:hypothetical protein